MAWPFRRLVRRKPNSLAGLEIRSASSLGSRWALIVSDIVVVAFIEAYPGGRSPYGQLPETTPPLVEATPRPEAPPAETGTGPSPRVGALPDRRRAARLHGGPRAHGVRRNLHRAAPTVLATLAPRHPEGHWRGPGVRGDPRIPHVSQGTVHGIPIGSDLGKGDGSKPLRGSGHRGKPGSVCRNGTEPTAASRNASAESGPMTGSSPVDQILSVCRASPGLLPDPLCPWLLVESTPRPASSNGLLASRRDAGESDRTGFSGRHHLAPERLPEMRMKATPGSPLNAGSPVRN